MLYEVITIDVQILPGQDGELHLLGKNSLHEQSIDIAPGVMGDFQISGIHVMIAGYGHGDLCDGGIGIFQNLDQKSDFILFDPFLYVTENFIIGKVPGSDLKNQGRNNFV